MTSRGAALLLAVLLATGCSSGDPEPADAELGIPEESSEEAAAGLLAQTNERSVLLFFPSDEGDLLVPEKRVIFLTATLSSQVKQAVSEVLLGPGPGSEGAGAVPAFPARTRLLGIFILPDGTAVVDLGGEAASIPHGSAGELTAVYAVVNTITYNFPGLDRVRFLVEGEEVETLAGHVDLTRALGADLKRVDWGPLGAPAESLGAAAPGDRWVLEDPTPLPDKSRGPA